MPTTKLDLKQQAEALYVKTNLSKTEIAKILGLSRRTVQYWSGTYDWSRLKQSKGIMPGLIVENMQHILLRLGQKILQPDRAFIDPKPEEIKMMCQLGSTIKKLGTRAGLNETIELRDHFMDYMKTIDHDKALTFQPYIDGFIRNRALKEVFRVTNNKLDEYGCLIPDEPHDKLKESQIDIDTNMHWGDFPDQCNDGFSEDGTPLEEDIASFTDEELAEIMVAYETKCARDQQINGYIVKNHQEEKDLIAYELKNNDIKPATQNPPSPATALAKEGTTTQPPTKQSKFPIPNSQFHSSTNQSQFQIPNSKFHASTKQSKIQIPNSESHNIHKNLNRRQRRLLLKQQQNLKNASQ